jgi:hypothetical protein
MARLTIDETLAHHGATRLPAVDIESYNVELKDEDGFVGDRATHTAFLDSLERWRKALRAVDDDPFGKKDSNAISQKKLAALLTDGNLEAAGIVLSAIEEYAQSFASVVRRFFKLKAWRDTQRIVVGGGFRASRVGELAIGRAGVILKAEKIAIDLVPVRNDPQEAGLLGAVQLAPRWVFQGHDAILALDVGGSTIRAGVVALNLRKASDLSRAEVWKAERWDHDQEKHPTREKAVVKMAEMLNELVGRAGKRKLRLAPFIGIGCPGVIAEDGTIERGADNLPGKWGGRKFNLPRVLREEIPRIGDHEAAIVMHNDAVVQGLSELPAMADIERWGALTIGTGFGNAQFRNRPDRVEL